MSDSIELPVKQYASHTSNSMFESCREKYYLRYVLGYKPKVQGASLHFGSAVEEALNHILRAFKEGSVEESLTTWQKVFLDGPKGWNQILDNPKHKFSKADYNKSVLEHYDTENTVAKWTEELGLDLDTVIKRKGTVGKRDETGEVVFLTENEKLLYSRVAWLSLKYKGLLMVEAFIKEFLPKVEEVICLQYELKGEVEIQGQKSDGVSFVDLIVRLKGYSKPIIIDIKTAAQAYKDDEVKKSPQLGLYTYGLSDELGSNLAGFLVLLKTPKTKGICKLCGSTKKSSHKTCNIKQNGVRCDGEWDTHLEGHTQLLIDEITLAQQESTALNFVVTSSLSRQNLRGKNLNSCDKYGGCDYKELCHNNDYSGVYKSETKIEPKVKEE